MSGTVVAVYSRVLEPGQDILITEDVTVQITNITLEVDEKSTDTSRTTLKMQHLQAHPALLQAVAGYDSDSEDDFDDDEDSEDDEDDLDEDELADMSKLSKASAASTSSKKSANGKAPVEEDDEEDEDFDEEDDDDEDEDSDEDEFDRQEAEVQICSLLPGKVEHFNTNIILPGGEDFVFRVTGTHKVHLFGHYLYQPVPPSLEEDQDPYGEGEYDSDEEIDSDDLDESEMGMYDPESGLMIGSDSEDYDSEDDDEEDADVSARFMEIEEAPKKAAKAAASAPKATSAAEEAAAAATKLSKNQLKKLAKKDKEAAPAAAAPVEKKAEAAKKPESKKEEAKAAPAPAAAIAAKKAPSKKQTLPSGLVFEDNKVGTGAVAKSGQRVSMRYIGRLNNGKIFDQNTKGAPFTFKLGKGEVIKGWDEGIAGMQVGGERKLVIPAKLAYGKQGVEGIPANSTLTFEVKLLSIK